MPFKHYYLIYQYPHFYQAGDFNAEVFNCAWTDMAISNRKILIIMMTLGQRTPKFEVKPFIVVNREYFAEVYERNIIKVYFLISLISRSLKKPTPLPH